MERASTPPPIREGATVEAMGASLIFADLPKPAICDRVPTYSASAMGSLL